MSADTEPAWLVDGDPSVWNTGQVRDLVTHALACNAGDSQVDAVMDVFRDLLAAHSKVEHESAAARQLIIDRQRERIRGLQRELRLAIPIGRIKNRELTELMVAGTTVRVTAPDGHVYPDGRITGMADHPTVRVDGVDGIQRVLPQAFKFEPVSQ